MKFLYKFASVTMFAIFFTACQLFATGNESNVLADEWSIDASHSAIEFTVTHFFTPVDGEFEDYSGDIIFDPNDLDNSKIDVTIPVQSINTGNERRDGHLNSDDFFNSSEYPNIHFVSTSIEQTGENQFVAHGELTIKDVTKEFELPFELRGVMEHPMRENTMVAGIVANAKLDRTEYGVGVGDWAATAVVGDEVEINLKLELNSSM